MTAEFIEGLPLCPYCGEQMDCSSSGSRDSETMGGDSVDYYRCRHHGEFELINGELSESY